MVNIDVDRHKIVDMLAGYNSFRSRLTVYLPLS